MHVLMNSSADLFIFSVSVVAAAYFVSCVKSLTQIKYFLKSQKQTWKDCTNWRSNIAVS